MAGVPALVFVESLLEQGVGPFVGVPCSTLGPVLSYLQCRFPELYITAANEGEAVAIAAGLQLAGRRPCVFLQNSGLGNAVNPLTSLCHALEIPVLMLIGWRGEPGRPDEPQHRLMGSITNSVLTSMGIAHEPLVEDREAAAAQVRRAIARSEQTSLPFALLVRKGTILRHAISADRGHEGTDPPAGMRREDAIGVVVSGLADDTAVVSTTGMASRELERDWDRLANLYMVGSMGCAASIALGVALGTDQRRRVVVLDGDGAALMRLEALTTVGRMAPANLAHFVLDNGAHDSTGGQPTGSAAVDLVGVARSCGYRTSLDVSSKDRLAAVVAALDEQEGPVFVRVRIVRGADPDLGRPALAPPQSARRFAAAIGAGS